MFLFEALFALVPLWLAFVVMTGQTVRGEAPMKLKSVWTTAALTASGGLPNAASCAVTEVPTLAPSTRAIPASEVMSPSLANVVRHRVALAHPPRNAR